jgi:uncharacterized protein (DUF2062 family)
MRQKILNFILKLIQQGATPQGLALSFAAGITFGAFPLVGTTTLLCLGAGFVFKLNQPMLQAANYSMAVPQLVLMPLFLRIGERVLGSTPVSIWPPTLMKDFFASPSLFMKNYGLAGAHAVLGWALAAPLIFLAISTIARFIFTQINLRLIKRDKN